MNELIEYVKSPQHDLLLLQWYSVLWSGEDGDKVMPTETSALSTFFEYMRTAQLVFKTNENGIIWFAAWLRPALGGAQFDMWIAPDRRSGKSWLEAMEQALEYGFERYNVLLGLTTQANLIDGHKRLGYTVVGEIPHLWDGDKPVHVMYITKELFDKRQARCIRRAANG